MGSGITVVPWFSRQEWIETFEAAFSSDVNHWKDAKDTMLVWQARVEKVPAGIDVTLPLLQAKIMEMDPSVEEAVKSIFLASALQRFVTAIVKLPQTKYYHTQSMHSLALEIGLPMHLVDLRNEIVHGHGGWGGGMSVHKALDVSYKWIKGYYWDAEFQKMSHSISITPERWQSFLCLLRRYARLTMSFATKKIPVFNKVKKILVQQLEVLYPLEPEDCVEAVVQYVLLPDASLGLPQQLETDDVCGCGCCIDGCVLTRVLPLLTCFFRFEKGIELLLTQIIKKGQEHVKLATEWICIICGTLLEMRCLSSHEEHCANHSLVLEDPPAKVHWKKVVTELLLRRLPWASDIAERIMHSSKIELTEQQREDIKSLFALLHHAPEVNSRENKAVCHPLEYYTVDDILTAAKNLPLGYRRNLEKLRISTVGLASDLVTVDSPVGILPHQTDNSLLYKDMVLHYPYSGDAATPPLKRCRLQAESVC